MSGITTGRPQAIASNVTVNPDAWTFGVVATATTDPRPYKSRTCPWFNPGRATEGSTGNRVAISSRAPGTFRTARTNNA
ncbi:hypothetical protein ACFQ1S_14425 [Kibdelosporangium lantanae]|uniref:Uncharacterized protein n=1 Tax=Kibdelosporangium lantanae TaxID=1497396 RepID=A0ABW3M923_9PSEU